MKRLRVVVVGSGGREHALARRLSLDPVPVQVIGVPGNEGMAAPIQRRVADERDVEALARVCADEAPDLVVVGPEGPLAAGLADRLAERGIPTLGPVRAAARREASKWFAKELMREAGIPTARAECFESAPEAEGALGRLGPPWVIKADGLAAGKGVCVTASRSEASAFLRECLVGDRFGAAGRRVLLEEHLSGQELSVMAVCDGERAVLLPAARDYKRAYDGDAGPNTGGMGAYAPHGALDAEGETFVLGRIVYPVLATLARRGAAYRGVLYCGLMRTSEGLFVLEFNVRFGDPETQVILPLLEGSLFELLAGAARGRLAAGSMTHKAEAAVAVALVDEAYPGPSPGGAVIEQVSRLEGIEHTWLLIAGARRVPRGWELTAGRGAYVCAAGADREEARARAYGGVDRLAGAGWRCRRDIALETAPEVGRVGVRGGGAHAT